MVSRIIHSSHLIDALASAGILPPNCRRVIIDMEATEAVHLHYECFRDERLLSVLSPLTESKIAGVDDFTSSQRIMEGKSNVGL